MSESNQPKNAKEISDIVSKFRQTGNINELVKRLDYNIPLVDFQLTYDELKSLVPLLTFLNFTEMNDHTSDIIKTASSLVKHLTLWGCYVENETIEFSLKKFHKLESLMISWTPERYQINFSFHKNLKKVEFICFTPMDEINFTNCVNLETFLMKHPKPLKFDLIFSGCERLTQLKLISVHSKAIDISGCNNLKK